MAETFKGLVLREVRYKESDRMLTLLTDKHGLLSIKAQGALGRKSRIAAATQLLCFSEFSVSEARYTGGRWRIDVASVIDQFEGLRADFANLALGVYFAELLATVCAEDVPDTAALSLGLNALYALSRRLYEPEHIKAVFELRLMASEGFEPELDRCGVCGRADVIEPMFAPQAGILHCRSCASSVYGAALPLDADSLTAMRHIMGAEPKKIYNFAILPESEQRLGRVAEAFSARQLDRLLPSLDYWKSVK